MASALIDDARFEQELAGNVRMPSYSFCNKKRKNEASS
jgi:hypothetical protein